MTSRHARSENTANLGEIANEMTSIVISQCQYIEDKWLDVVIESLVVEKQLGQKTQVLTVDLRRIPVHFKYGPVVLAIDFTAGRMQQSTSCLYTTQ